MRHRDKCCILVCYTVDITGGYSSSRNRSSSLVVSKLIIHDMSFLDSQPNLLGFEDRVGYVRPSRQLLDFYRKKISEYENKHEVLVKRLAQYKQSYEENHQLEWEIRTREDEIAELQKALSDMQVFLFKEREQVLNLYKENDGFKARDLENKRTVQQLLALQGCAVDGEISYFFKEPPEQPIIPDKTNYKDCMNRQHQGRPAQKEKSTKLRLPNRLKEIEKPDQVTLMLQVEALQSQLSDQARWAKEFLEALNEDKRIKETEHETIRERDLHKIKALTEKLHRTQDLLYESTQDILRLRRDWKESENTWIGEKDKLILELDKCRGRLNLDMQIHPDASLHFQHNESNNVKTMDSAAKFRLESKKLRNELEETQRMSEMYREQVISMEDEIASYKEKEHLKSDMYNGKVDNMSKRYQIMKTRYEDLEKRRNLEVEGFKNDVKFLRKQLKDMERQLYKATLQFGGPSLVNNPDDVDLAVLHEVKKTAVKSLKLNSKLKGVKKDVYQLETDMRHL